MHPDFDCVLFTQEQIAIRVKEIAFDITRDYQGKTPLLVGVLKGSFIFMADLVRSIDLPCDMDFMAVSSVSDKQRDAFTNAPPA